MDEITQQLTALLARWNDLAATSAGKIEAADNPIQGGFYAGVLLGAEIARDELAGILAKLQSDAVQL